MAASSSGAGIGRTPLVVTKTFPVPLLRTLPMTAAARIPSPCNRWTSA
ncbi:MAG: hypothetical protein NTX40_09635 [Planctomycetota bacterium]|nr:hypothetical protein [Planctomycetota bacterium]